jgi:hypothetical protein
MGRFSYILCKYFEYAGFKIIIKANKHYFRNISRYKKSLLKERYTLVKRTSTPINTVVLVIPERPDKTISLTYGYDVLKTDRYDCIAPFMLHPNFYKSYPSQEILFGYRTKERRTRILFSGNNKPTFYNRSQLQDKFGIIPRFQVLEFVKTQFKNGHILTFLTDRDDLYQTLIDNEALTPLIISEAKSEQGHWLEIVSSATFFLCPPGVVIPLCHNLIEAMAVGTIPILQYGNSCNPPLKHMHNCLSFSSLQDLRQAIDLALIMDSEEIMRMKKNVVSYYQDYLSLESTVESIKKFCASDTLELTVAIQFIKENRNAPE